MNEKFAGYVNRGIFTERQVAAYELFKSDAGRKWLEEEQKMLFNLKVPSFDVGGLAFVEGQRDLVRQQFEIMNMIDLTLQNEGKECLSYLPENQKE